MDGNMNADNVGSPPEILEMGRPEAPLDESKVQPASGSPPEILEIWDAGVGESSHEDAGGKPEAPLDRSKVQRVNRWLIGAVVVLAVALVAVGTWAIVDSPSEETAPAPMQIVPHVATVETIDNLTAAMKADPERIASFFAEDGVFMLQIPGKSAVVDGHTDIARYMQDTVGGGWNVERAGVVAQWGNRAAQAIRAPDGFTGMAIYEFTPRGEISHMWVYGDYQR